MNLPVFKYHRDPMQSGSVIESNTTCKCCSEIRGYIYTGPVYAEDELDDSLCPWCIADGSAHTTFDATFVDDAELPDALPAEAIDELVCRTPGYSAWQTERWFSCCGDAMVFLEPAGLVELRSRYPELEFNIRGNILYDLHISGGAVERTLTSLNRNTGPTAYVFHCAHCGAYQTFVDGIFDVGTRF
jgi:uncharacterized protein CbrC (UPF0167 family)